MLNKWISLYGKTTVEKSEYFRQDVEKYKNIKFIIWICKRHWLQINELFHPFWVKFDKSFDYRKRVINKVKEQMINPSLKKNNIRLFYCFLGKKTMWTKMGYESVKNI